MFWCAKLFLSFSTGFLFSEFTSSVSTPLYSLDNRAHGVHTRLFWTECAFTQNICKRNMVSLWIMASFMLKTNQTDFWVPVRGFLSPQQETRPGPPKSTQCVLTPTLWRQFRVLLAGFLPNAMSHTLRQPNTNWSQSTHVRWPPSLVAELFLSRKIKCCDIWRWRDSKWKINVIVVHLSRFLSCVVTKNFKLTKRQAVTKVCGSIQCYIFHFLQPNKVKQIADIEFFAISTFVSFFPGEKKVQWRKFNLWLT